MGSPFQSQRHASRPRHSNNCALHPAVYLRTSCPVPPQQQQQQQQQQSQQQQRQSRSPCQVGRLCLPRAISAEFGDVETFLQRGLDDDSLSQTFVAASNHRQRYRAKVCRREIQRQENYLALEAPPLHSSRWPQAAQSVWVHRHPLATSGAAAAHRHPRATGCHRTCPTTQPPSTVTTARRSVGHQARRRRQKERRHQQHVR